MPKGRAERSTETHAGGAHRRARCPRPDLAPMAGRPPLGVIAWPGAFCALGTLPGRSLSASVVESTRITVVCTIVGVVFLAPGREPREPAVSARA